MYTAYVVLQISGCKITNRKQYVVIDDHSSDLLDMTCGVPQGSVLGPILFIIYLNDICNVSDVVKCVLFADDTNIFCSERNLTDLQLTLNLELGKQALCVVLSK